MKARFDINEDEIAAYFAQYGLSEVAAAVYTILLCKQYQDTAEGLVHALDIFFPGAPDKDTELNRSINLLLEKGLVSEVEGKSRTYLKVAQPWDKVVSQKLGISKLDGHIKKTVGNLISRFEAGSPHTRELIERVGWASSDAAKEAYRHDISTARQHIRLGVYSSKIFFHDVADCIKDAWTTNKISVDILMLSPELAADVEGNKALENDVKEGVENWIRCYKEIHEIAGEAQKSLLKIRHLKSRNFVGFPRMMLTDEGNWILNVHRPCVERAIEGMVFKGAGNPRIGVSNMFRFLDYFWRSAWRRSIEVFPEQKPRVFIGSASEDMNVAEQIEQQLESVAEVTVWKSTKMFPGGKFILEALLDSKEMNFDFAVLVASGVDKGESRGVEVRTPRDNVIFEMGMFLERLGRERTFVIVDRTTTIKLPSDIGGLLTGNFKTTGVAVPDSSITDFCSEIKESIKNKGKFIAPAD